MVARRCGITDALCGERYENNQAGHDNIPSDGGRIHSREVRQHRVVSTPERDDDEETYDKAQQLSTNPSREECFVLLQASGELTSILTTSNVTAKA